MTAQRPGKIALHVVQGALFFYSFDYFPFLKASLDHPNEIFGLAFLHLVKLIQADSTSILMTCVLDKKIMTLQSSL